LYIYTYNVYVTLGVV